tara:strand:+ start:1528 stop:2130 length:603 start_codon:yes stop_codon:yes gene_type:complete
MNSNYYDILEIEMDCTKPEIKKSYRKLSLKYHPDKNDGNDEKFKQLNEAYEVLYDDESRQIYNIKLVFKDVKLNDEDIEILKQYYYKIINSKEYRLAKLLYLSIPSDAKSKLWKKYNDRKNITKQIIVAPKSIDIQELNEDLEINLRVSYQDYISETLKRINIYSKNGIYYLFIRKIRDKIILDNDNCKLTINFFIINNK